MIEYKYPANKAEAEANRARFIEALRTEPASNQCQYALYEDADVEGDSPAEVKHQKCAVGLAAQVFFGITNQEELSDWQARGLATAGHADIYRAVEEMLGLDNSAPNYVETVDSVIEYNDGQGLSFADIAGRLSQDWNAISGKGAA